MTIAAAPTGRSRLKRIFVGADGLRAGWSLAIYYVAAATGVVLYAIFAPRPAAGPDTAWITIESLAPQAAALLLIAFAMSRIERRPFGAYGLRPRHVAADFALGIFCGIALLSALIGALWLAGGVTFGPPDFSDGWRKGGDWLIAFLLVGFVEEFWFRGFFQFTLARGLAGLLHWAWPGFRHARAFGFWLAAAVLSGLFFVLGHRGNGGENALGLASVALVGFVLAFSLYRSGALWWGIGFHAAWDWTETFLFGAADSGHVARDSLLVARTAGPTLLSGGSAGPEGSVLVFPTLLLAALLVAILYRRRTSLGAEPPS